MDECLESENGIHQGYDTGVIVLKDLDTGFAQILWKCKNCGIEVQKSSMLNTFEGYEEHKHCIIISKGKNISRPKTLEYIKRLKK